METYTTGTTIDWASVIEVEAMPLTLVQVELLGLDSKTLRMVRAVHAFLKASPDLAFTPEEISACLQLDVERVSRILEKFDDIYLVESGSSKEARYFRYLADLPDID
jgi:hypothetical protein